MNLMIPLSATKASNSSENCFILNMDAVDSSEMSLLIYQFTSCYIPENVSLTLTAVRTSNIVGISLFSW